MCTCFASAMARGAVQAVAEGELEVAEQRSGRTRWHSLDGRLIHQLAGECSSKRCAGAAILRRPPCKAMLRQFALLLLLGAASVAAGSRNCSYDSSEAFVYCRVSEWGPWLLRYLEVNISRISSLHVHVLEQAKPLTRTHLRGLTNLTSLVLLGSCSPSPRDKWCDDAAGVTEIDFDAFDETPKLQQLRLQCLPISDLQALARLRRLRVLHLQWLKNLTQLPARVVLGAKASLEVVTVWYTSIYELPEAIFAGFPRLQRLELNVANRLDIGSRAIADLPELRSLFLAFYMGKGALTLDRFAISNITQLQEVNIYSVRNLTMLGSPVCSGSASVRKLLMQGCELSFLTHCPLFLSCPGCKSQRVAIMHSFLADHMSTAILPPPEVVPSYNITRIELYQTSFIYPFAMFPQLPRLRELVIEHSMRGRANMGFWRLPRFLDNPFAQLPASARLREVRMTVRSCGCRLLEILAWMRENAQASNRTLEETFFLDCLEVASVCAESGKDQRRFLSWLDLPVVEARLKSVCPISKEVAVLSATEGPELDLNCRCTDIGSCAGPNTGAAPSTAILKSQECVSVAIFLALLASLLLG